MSLVDQFSPHSLICAEAHKTLRAARREIRDDPIEKKRHDRESQRNSQLRAAVYAERNAVKCAQRNLQTLEKDMVREYIKAERQAIVAGTIVRGDVDAHVELDMESIITTRHTYGATWSEVFLKQTQFKTDLQDKIAILKAKRSAAKAQPLSTEKTLIRSVWREPLGHGWKAHKYTYGKFGVESFWVFSHPDHGERTVPPTIVEFPHPPVEFRIARDGRAYNQTEFTLWERANNLPIGSEWNVAPQRKKIGCDGKLHTMWEFMDWEKANNLPIGSEWEIASVVKHAQTCGCGCLSGVPGGRRWRGFVW